MPMQRNTRAERGRTGLIRVWRKPSQPQTPGPQRRSGPPNTLPGGVRASLRIYAGVVDTFTHVPGVPLPMHTNNDAAESI